MPYADDVASNKKDIVLGGAVVALLAAIGYGIGYLFGKNRKKKQKESGAKGDMR